MGGKATSSLDKKGRVLIPQSMRDALNLKSGEKVIVSADSKNHAILIEPAHEKRLLRLEIALSDSPGSLASAAAALAKLGVDLVSTQSHSSRRGESAVWVVQCNPGSNTSSEIRASLAKSGARLLLAKWE